MPGKHQKNKKRKSKRSTKYETKMPSCFMFPALHEAVSEAVENEISVPIFRNSDDNDDVRKDWSTNIMGRFRCINANCGTHSWWSQRIAILIRSYYGNEYNAVVFNQYCRSCEEPGSMEIDEAAYVDRVAYRLKKWAGVHMEPPPFDLKKGLPHKGDLCEGCRRGYCQKAPMKSDA